MVFFFSFLTTEVVPFFRAVRAEKRVAKRPTPGGAAPLARLLGDPRDAEGLASIRQFLLREVP